MFDALGGTIQQVRLTLYTDSFVVRGALTTRQRRVTDMLNLAEDRFLVLSDVSTDEFGPRGEQVRAEFAQVNLASVLFAVVNEPVSPTPELRTVIPDRKAATYDAREVVRSLCDDGEFRELWPRWAGQIVTVSRNFSASASRAGSAIIAPTRWPVRRNTLEKE